VTGETPAIEMENLGGYEKYIYLDITLFAWAIISRRNAAVLILIR